MCPDEITFGAFVDDQLVGFVGLQRALGKKTRHRTMLAAMYVIPEMRRRRIGAALVAHTIRHAQTWAALEELILAVMVGNAGAGQLYAAAGFVASHIEPRYIKLDGQYCDIEWMRLLL